MRRHGILALTTSLMLSASIAAAQDTIPQRPRADCMEAAASSRRGMMVMMDSLNRRLDSLVGRMNRAEGSQKVPAMSDVINELVAQRKGMHQHMHMMMEGGRGMRMMGPGTKPCGRPAPPE
jgi:hypothetical protein